MITTRVYATEWEIDQRLARVGATRLELVDVARQTLASRSDAVAIDVLSMPGHLSYLYGTRYLRLLFLQKGWNLDRRENVESVINPQTGVRIVFQNVDQACSPFYSPQAISGKGPAADRLINSAQGRLFSLGEAPEVVAARQIDQLNSSVWYFCMSFNGDDVSAELSLPAAVSGNNFSSFLERIFIIEGGSWGGSVSVPHDDSPVELLPTVTRR